MPALNVLIIENAADEGQDLAMKVRDLGYGVIGVFSSGEEAVQSARKERPDIVLLDVGMIGASDGFNPARALMALDLPVILITDNSDRDTITQAAESGIAGYLLKPYDDRYLAVQIELIWAKAHTERQLRKQAQRLPYPLDETLEISRAMPDWEQRLRAFVTATSDIVYQMSPDWSLMYRLHGRQVLTDTTEPTSAWLYTYIPIEEQPLVRKTIAEAIRTKSLYQLEHRVHRPDGSIGWVLSRAVPLFHATGQIREWFGTATDITERKASQEAALKRSRLLDLSQDAIIVRELQGGILYWNAGAEHLYGWTSKEALGQPAHDLLKTTSRDRIEALNRELMEKGSVQSELSQQAKHGHDITVMTRWVLDSSSEPPLVLETNTDITEQRRVEHFLRESEKRFRLLADSAPVLIWTTGPQGTEFCNRACIDFLGVKTEEELHEHNWANYVHPDDYERYVGGYLAAYERCERYEGDLRLHRHDGEYRWFHSLCLPRYDNAKNFVGYVGCSLEIHDSKLAATAIQQSESQLRAVVERSPFGTYIVDGAFRIVHMNQAGQDGAFRNIKTVIGCDLSNALRILWPEPIADSIAGIFRHTLETGESYRSQKFTHARADIQQTESYEWELHRLPMTDGSYGVICYYYDSSELRNAEARLSQTVQRLRLAMESAQMGAWDADLESGALIWDARQCEIFGCELAPKSTEDFFSLVHPDDVSRFRAATAKMVEAGSIRDEFRALLPNGQIRWIATLGATIRNAEGRSVRAIGVNYDVTEQKISQKHMESFAQELERQVHDRTADLVESQTRLRELATELNLAEQRERQRLADELHDHLAQLLVLIGFKLSQAKQGAAGQTLTLVEKARLILQEALDYTRELVAQLSPPVLREFGLPDALQWLGEQMNGFGLKVAVDIQVPDKLVIPKDQGVLLFQSTRELLINVAKHARVSVATLSLSYVAGRLVICVRDEGVGFVASSKQKAKNKFGLYSISERMQALGGEFCVDSAPGQGTLARISLPMHQDMVAGKQPQQKSVDAKTQPSALSVPVGPRCRVLIADDHAMVRQGLRSVLENFPDIECVGEASNGLEAVEMADRLCPTVVLIDVNMPVMDGIHATAKIKTRNPGIVVIGLSVNVSRENVSAMMTAGASRLLTKEAAVERLYSAIKEAVNGFSSHDTNDEKSAIPESQ